ncbi:uncharacterized protein FFB20_02351 [Fusarium fujikuroi]|uniref:Uncharacterized protein n=1 Tax=Fusarium fujikuroi TaxID=5127 RepID=A0A2H3RXD9_FUSFU|nr:Uncharacterized protein Y057_13282 [Fusarium fujikuroi]SCN66829.1 uncharacterized protein FFB20_02351 [Fusarium fujikuroi]SCN81840.1 uncharacterized protein FFE2_04813 [Fusarium fujikuroi]SCN85086.1 uncharacterized protein FFC1_04778 [Fusarium fujikuroi]SCO34250.1 uncharacterized protein FFNC_03721 [Fusarium fujikuroi]
MSQSMKSLLTSQGMEETGESSRSGANNKSSKTTNILKPSVDVTDTKGWASISPRIVGVGHAVTHNNLGQLASLLQAIMGKMGEQEKKLNKLTKAFGGDSGNTSRRSSMGSVGHQSSVGEGEVSVETTHYDEIMGNLELLDGLFEGFLLSSEHRPLTRRTKNIQPSVDGFMEAVQQGQVQENAMDGDIVSKLQSLETKEAQDVYLALSKRYNTHNSKGKRVATVTQSFETDIVDDAAGEGGSQSTEPQTPKDRKGKSVARPPKTPAARRRRESSSLFVLSDDEEEAEGAEGQTPMPASTEDKDSTFQPN